MTQTCPHHKVWTEVLPTSFFWQIWHFLVIKIFTQFFTCHTFMDDSSRKCISTKYPNTILSQVTQSQPPSIMTYSLMTPNNHCLSNIARLRQKNWMCFITGQFGSTGQFVSAESTSNPQYTIAVKKETQFEWATWLIEVSKKVSKFYFAMCKEKK